MKNCRPPYRTLQAIAFMIFFLTSVSEAQQPTLGLMEYDTVNTDGYVLFAPMSSRNTYIIDKCGKQIKKWTSSFFPGASCYLLEDGSMIRAGNVNNFTFSMAGGVGGIIEQYNWDGTLRWSYRLSSSTMCMHHDFKVLPNGNILVISWQVKSPTEQTNAGRSSSLSQTAVWSESILELHPVGTNSATVVWQWNLWDHLVQDSDATKPNFGDVSDHPELVNVNYTGSVFGGLSRDWIHLNAIDYNPELDQIVVSSFTFNEIWVIDHSTTTSEAASHSGGHLGKGGDLAYRWGNPIAYERGAQASQKYFHQHNVQWIKPGLPNAGKLMVFNNGFGRPGIDTFSSVDIIDPPINTGGSYSIIGSDPYGPTDYFWEYTAPVKSDLYSQLMSSTQLLPNGSLITCSALTGDFWEIDSTGKRVWRYINPVAGAIPMRQGQNPIGNLAFRCTFYAPGYAGFAGRTLTPGQELELQPTRPALCEIRNIVTTPNTGVFCAGSSITARFTSDGSFYSDNKFYFELSDPTGNFASSMILDSVGGRYAVPFDVKLPANLPFSNQYRYRINSSNPPAIGSDNGGSITILSPPKVSFDCPRVYQICNFKAPVRVTASGGVSYQWSDGVDSASRLISSPGRYYVTVANTAGCERRDSVEIVNIPFTEVKITPTKSTTICEGTTTGLIASGGQYFRWSTGDTTKLIVVSKQGWYKVTSTDSTSCSSTDSIYIKVNPIPNISLNQAGTLSICPGDTITLTATPSSNYFWSTGDTTRSIRVASGGNYFVTTRNNNDCTGSSSVVIVRMLTAPEKPVIARSGDMLTTKATPPLQWFLNGKLIPGANGYTLVPETNGNYTVSTEENGCKSISDVFVYSTLSGVASSETNSVHISISPNPFTDRLGIKIESPTRSYYKIECYSVLGEKIGTIFEGMLNSGDNELSYLFPNTDRDGAYFVRIQSGSFIRTFKVMRQ